MPSQGKTRAACLIGWPAAHSRSPLIHHYWLRTLGIEGGYVIEAVPPEDFKDFLFRLSLRGFVGANVTRPHKEHALALSAPDERARAVGAANTLWFADGELRSTNTDVEGFINNLDACAPGWDKTDDALVLGAGIGATAGAGDSTRGLAAASFAGAGAGSGAMGSSAMGSGAKAAAIKGAAAKGAGVIGACVVGAGVTGASVIGAGVSGAGVNAAGSLKLATMSSSIAVGSSMSKPKVRARLNSSSSNGSGAPISAATSSRMA